MKKGLSGNKDTDRLILILSKIDDKELLKICSIDKYTWNSVCDDDFLKRRLLDKYPEIEKYKLGRENWKQFFLKAIHLIALMKEKFKYEYTFGNFKKQYNLLKEYNKDLYELLMKSVRAGELSLVIWCIKNGVKINTSVLGEHALINASMYGYLEIVKYLVENGANDKDSTALMNASSYGHFEVVKYLVEHGSDIHADNDYALRLANEYGRSEVVNYLKSKMY